MQRHVHSRTWEKRGEDDAENFRNERHGAGRVENPQHVEEDAVELLQYLARHPSIDADALAGAVSSSLARQHSAPPLTGTGAVAPPPPQHPRVAMNHGASQKHPPVPPGISSMEPTTPPSTFANLSMGNSHNNSHNNVYNNGEQRLQQRMQQEIQHQVQQHLQVTTTLPHAPFLTAPHMRTGKGGRKPSVDPRMDPNIDPKKAKRILANRLSAAKSTLKKKIRVELLGSRIDGLLRERDGLEVEVAELEIRFTAALAANAQLMDMV